MIHSGWDVWIAALMVEGLHLACRLRWSHCLIQREREIWISWEGSYTFLIYAEHISAWIFPWIITGHVMMGSTTLCRQSQRQGCEQASLHTFRCSKVVFPIWGSLVCRSDSRLISDIWPDWTVWWVAIKVISDFHGLKRMHLILSSDFSASSSMGFTFMVLSEISPRV